MTIRFFERLSNNLSSLLLDNDEYNVIIEVGEAPNHQTFKAHSIILNSRCSYFKNLLSKTAYENNIKTIKDIKRLRIDVLNEMVFIRFISKLDKS